MRRGKARGARRERLAMPVVAAREEKLGPDSRQRKTGVRQGGLEETRGEMGEVQLTEAAEASRVELPKAKKSQATQ